MENSACSIPNLNPNTLGLKVVLRADMLKGKTSYKLSELFRIKNEEWMPYCSTWCKAVGTEQIYTIEKEVSCWRIALLSLNTSQQFNLAAKEGNLVIWLHSFHSTGSYYIHFVL